MPKISKKELTKKSHNYFYYFFAKIIKKSGNTKNIPTFFYLI